MESLLISIFRSYGIETFFLKDKENIEIIILKREKTLKMNQWISLNSAIAYKFRKKLVFLSKEEAINLYGHLNDFRLIKGDLYE